MIHFDLNGLEDAKRALSGKAYRNALKRAATRTIPTAKRIVRDTVTDKYNIKKRRVDKITSVSKTVGKSSIRIVLGYSDTRIGLLNFKAGLKKVQTNRGRRTKLFVKIKKTDSNRFVKAGFIGRGKASIAGNRNILVFARQSKDRDDIKALKTIAIPEMIGTTSVVKKINKQLGARYHKELSSSLQYALGRAYGKGRIL